MKLIFISGPSGSGKTTLSKKIIGKIKNGIILSTDNYYKVGLLSKFLSKFVASYFYRSINNWFGNIKEFFKDINCTGNRIKCIFKRKSIFPLLP